MMYNLSYVVSSIAMMYWVSYLVELWNANILWILVEVVLGKSQGLEMDIDSSRNPLIGG